MSDLALVTLAKSGDKHTEIEQLAWVPLFGISLSTVASLFSSPNRDWFVFTVLCCTKVNGLRLTVWACVMQTTAARLKPTLCLLTTVHMIFASYVILLEQLCRNRSHLIIPYQNFKSGFIFLLFLQRILFVKYESDQPWISYCLFLHPWKHLCSFSFPASSWWSLTVCQFSQ